MTDEITIDTGTEVFNLRSLGLLRIHHSCTGYRGVWFDKDKQKYRAEVGNFKKGTRKRLGSFVNPEDAARAYDAAALERYGKYACLNFPHPGENRTEPNRRTGAQCHYGHSTEDFGYVDVNGAASCRECMRLSQRSRKLRLRFKAKLSADT